MKNAERNVVRLAVVQYLRSRFGIKTKNWNKCKNCKGTTGNSLKIFGVALECLPHCHVLDYGYIPCFLVDACTCLLEHLDTEGLFRKSGSVVRLKSLRTKLDQAEECLSSAMPSDIAGLVKQFFRELPEPLISTDLQSSFLKAQELSTDEYRTSATILLCCVLPQEKLTVLRYFCSFLKRVSQRSSENKMDSSNLSVIFSPNLFHWGDGTDKVNSSTEKRLKLQAAVLQCLIDNSSELGVVPEFLLDKVPAMLGCEVKSFSPSDAVEEGRTPTEIKRNRRSLGDMVNGALTMLKSNRTPSNTLQPERTVISYDTPSMTPKRKLPMESGQSYLSNKKRRSIKKNLGIDLLPSSLFGGASTPGSVHSTSGIVGSCQSSTSPVGKSDHLRASSARRKSKRFRHRNVNRVESGKAGCFSPRVTKKEAMKKSLRLRFSLVKTSRDCNVISKGSEAIGWRLATQESTSRFQFTKDTTFNPATLKRSPSKDTKFVNKSECNLLTPCSSKDSVDSWSQDTPDGTQGYTDTPMKEYLSYSLEPSIYAVKPPVVSNMTQIICSATSAESLASSECYVKDNSQETSNLPEVNLMCDSVSKKGHTVDDEHGIKNNQEKTDHLCDIAAMVSPESIMSLANKRTENEVCQTPSKSSVNVFIEHTPLSPLHIDSMLFDADSSGWIKRTASFDDGAADSKSCSQLIDALDIQSPVAFRLSSLNPVQSTPFLSSKLHICTEKTVPLDASLSEQFKELPSIQESCKISGQLAVPMQILEPQQMKVADQIQRFNRLGLNSPKAKAVRAPIKFHRTPVRQSVSRFNSLLGQRTADRAGWCATSRPVIKTASLEIARLNIQQQFEANKISFSSNIKQDFSNPEGSSQKCPVFTTSKHCALGDVTNTLEPREKADGLSATKIHPCKMNSVLWQETNKCYRGSPKIPLANVKLLSAMKPIDF